MAASVVLAAHAAARMSPLAASVVLVAHAAARMSPCGGECRVGRSRCRADVAVWRRVSCWSHAAARWPVVAGARGAGAAPIRGTASIARSPPTNDRHQQTIDVGRRAPARARARIRRERVNAGDA